MPRQSDYIAAATALLEMTLFPTIIDAPSRFTDVGREKAAEFLAEFSEQEFNAGFDAAVRAILGRKGMSNVKVDHPDYLRDRSEAYRKARS